MLGNVYAEGQLVLFVPQYKHIAFSYMQQVKKHITLYGPHSRFTKELLNAYVKVKVKSLRHVQPFATPMDCSLPGSSVHGIFQAIVLEWIATPFSRGSSQSRDQSRVSRIVDRRLHTFNKIITQPLKMKFHQLQQNG